LNFDGSPDSSDLNVKYQLISNSRSNGAIYPMLPMLKQARRNREDTVAKYKYISKRLQSVCLFNLGVSGL